MSLTDARSARRSINDPRVRAALKLLHEAGWSADELKMTFQASDGAVRRVLDGTMACTDPRQFRIPAPGELRAMRKRSGLTRGQAGSMVDKSTKVIQRLEAGDDQQVQRLRDLLAIYEEEIHG